MDGRSEEVSEEFGNAFSDEENQPASDGHSQAEPEPELVYKNPVEFFVELLSPSYVREVNEGAAFTWCPEWYKHPEAYIRIEAIWRAWEHLRLEPALGASTWWLNHADPHMRILMDKEGPFKKCAYDGHKPPTPEKAVLPHIAPETGIFD
jgi:hypothetical protein